jgi:polyhydroxyalkanoate synthesis regulator phasin
VEFVGWLSYYTAVKTRDEVIILEERVLKLEDQVARLENEIKQMRESG